MKEFQLKVLASAKVFYEGPCTSITLPTADGEYGILANHESMVVAIRAGEFRFQTADGMTEAFIGDGFARVANNCVTVLVDSVELPEEVDENRARAAMERAEEHLRHQESMREYFQNKIALNRAMARLRIKHKKHL